MEFWNSRKLKAPPTYTYLAKRDEVDIDYLKTTLQDGIKFYKEQYLLNLETALLARIIYRMKRKFQNSKDFKTLEKVKKDLMKFLQIGIHQKLELLLSVLPKNVGAVKIFLPTKNMIDFILVRLQGVGKILCRVIEMCKLSMKYYECRLYLGHFWRMALVAIGLVSRIYVLSLNMIKFTCLLYIRLLPFSHKLKNSGSDWLPKDHVFPKDLKDWLNIEWSQIDEVIEIPDKEFNFSFIDLVEDSDDDVQFCMEYIELDKDEDLEIINEFKKINKKIKPIKYESSLTVLRGFSSRHIDPGEVMSLSDEDGVDCQASSNENLLTTPKTHLNDGLYIEDKQIAAIEGEDIGELISSSDDENSEIAIQNVDNNKTTTESHNTHVGIQIEDNVLITSSDSDGEHIDISSNDSIKIVEELTLPSRRQNMVTSDFISLSTVSDNLSIQANKDLPKGISSNLCRRQNKYTLYKNIEDPSHFQDERKHSIEKHNNIIEITDSPINYRHTKITDSQVIPNNILENKKNCIDYIQGNRYSDKRQGEWGNCIESRKKPRWSKDILDTSCEILESMEKTDNFTQQNVCHILEIDNNIDGTKNINRQSDNKSINASNCSFVKLIENTSTLSRKQKKKQKKTRKDGLLKDTETVIGNPRKKRCKKISNVELRKKKQNKEFSRNSNSSSTDSRTQNKLVSSFSTTNTSISSVNSSVNASNKINRRKQKKSKGSK